MADMSEMFRFTRAFNADISNWVVSKVLNFHGFLAPGNKVFNADISKWVPEKAVSKLIPRDNFFFILAPTFNTPA